MADDVTSQARFMGWLALVLMVFAIAVAAFVIFAGTSVPPS